MVAAWRAGGPRQRRSRAGCSAHGRARRSRAGRGRARRRPCRARRAGSQASGPSRRRGARPPRGSRPPRRLRPARSRTSSPLRVEHLDDAAHGERDDGLGHRHRFDHGARQRIGVHAGHDRDVEVRDERSYVRAEAEHAEAMRPGRARRRAARHSSTWSGRKSSGVSPTTTNVTRARAASGSCASSAQPRGAHHLDVALATQHAPVAAEDDRVAREPELRAERSARRGPGRSRRRRARCG